MSKRLLVQESNAGWQNVERQSYGAKMSGNDISPAPALGEVIRGRIRQRIGDRVHELDVAVDTVSVVLRGRCATFYTKQLAQHAALGVLNNERLDNQIVVTSG